MDASDLETTQTGGALYTSKVDIETTQKSSDELFTLTVDLEASRTGGKVITSTSKDNGEEGRQERGRVITSGVITETNDRGESAEEIGQTTAMTAAGQRVEGRHFGVASQLQTAETEQLMAAEGEVKKTFAIKSVVNPADGTDISLQQAIVLGVILPDEGIYVNSVTGEKKPIPSAMSEGLIKVCIFKTSSSIEACVRLV